MVEEFKPTKFQIYLSEEEERAFRRYIENRFPPGAHGPYTIVMREAIAEFLRREGYLEPKVPAS